MQILPEALKKVGTGMENVSTEKLSKHVKLCRKNLKDKRVKCCATCPFEEIIIEHSPDLKELFETKRKGLK